MDVAWIIFKDKKAIVYLNGKAVKRGYKRGLRLVYF